MHSCIDKSVTNTACGYVTRKKEKRTEDTCDYFPIFNKKTSKPYFPSTKRFRALAQTVSLTDDVQINKRTDFLRTDIFARTMMTLMYLHNFEISFPTYRVFRKNCVFSQFTATPPSLTSL